MTINITRRQLCRTAVAVPTVTVPTIAAAEILPPAPEVQGHALLMRYVAFLAQERRCVIFENYREHYEWMRRYAMCDSMVDRVCFPEGYPATGRSANRARTVLLAAGVSLEVDRDD